MGGGGDVGSWTTKLYRDVHFAWSQTPKAIPGRSFFMDFSLRPVGMCLISSLLSTFFRAAPPKRFPNCFISLHFSWIFRTPWQLKVRMGSCFSFGPPPHNYFRLPPPRNIFPKRLTSRGFRNQKEGGAGFWPISPGSVSEAGAGGGTYRSDAIQRCTSVKYTFGWSIYRYVWYRFSNLCTYSDFNKHF